MRRSFIIFCFATLSSTAQVTLEADGPGNTYSLITSVLAPGFNPIEAPDCSHPEFGPHIEEIYDDDLGDNAFKFHIHVGPDDDRCINFDRQRNEIKAYDKSPDNLLGVEGERVTYSWKFKLSEGFQSSPKFTHLHQLKSVGGEFSSMPMYTLTTRKGDPDQLELRYAEVNQQITLAQTDLAPFIGVWLEVTETILYGEIGTYEVVIKSLESQEELFSYSTSNIINWRDAAEFVRPKWGIYRSLLFEEDLRDEEVLFADFVIDELATDTTHSFNPYSTVYQQGVLLNWTPPVDAIGCEVRGGAIGGNDGVSVTVVNGAPSFVFVNANALGNATYQWKVRCATDLNPPQGITGFSVYDTFSFPPPAEVPLAPESITEEGISKW